MRKILAAALLLSALATAADAAFLHGAQFKARAAPTPFTACRTALVEGTGAMVFTGSNGAIISKVGC
jgi:hypothetical protein